MQETETKKRRKKVVGISDGSMQKRMGYVYICIAQSQSFGLWSVRPSDQKRAKKKKKVVMRMIACLVVVDPKREQVIDDRSVASVEGVVRVVEERSEMLRNIGVVEVNVKPNAQLEAIKSTQPK